MMTVGSLFAGVEGFGLGFQQAGFETRWQVEKEPFCIAVLKTQFPDVERYYEIKDCVIGKKHKLGAVDVVTAGFPCQDLSVAGKRAGLAGTRSGLFWEVIRVVGELRPAWLVLENVPGLFSSNDGGDFACVLRELGKLRCFQSIAWTVLDSRYFGVAQRRRRVFIVCGARIGSSEQVLFESEGCEGDFAQSGEEGPCITKSAEECVGSLGTRSKCRGYSADEAAAGHYITSSSGERARALTGSMFKRHDEDTDTLIAHALSASAGHHGHSSPRGDGSDNLVPVGFQNTGQGWWNERDTAATIRTPEGGGSLEANVVAFALRENPGGIGQGWNTNFVAATLNSGGNSGGFRTEPGEHIISVRLAQTSSNGWGISEDGTIHTLDSTGGDAVCAQTYPHRVRNAPGISEGLDDSRFSLLPEGIDSPRYRALGNAVTVNVSFWIAKRIREWTEKNAKE